MGRFTSKFIFLMYPLGTSVSAIFWRFWGKVRVWQKGAHGYAPFLSTKCVFSCLKIFARLRAKILQIRGKTGHYGVKMGITISSSPAGVTLFCVMRFAFELCVSQSFLSFLAGGPGHASAATAPQSSAKKTTTGAMNASPRNFNAVASRDGWPAALPRSRKFAPGEPARTFVTRPNASHRTSTVQPGSRKRPISNPQQFGTVPIPSTSPAPSPSPLQQCSTYCARVQNF